MFEKLDYFKEYRINEATRTRFGATLTLLVPLLLVGFIVWQVLVYQAEGFTVNFDVVPNAATIFEVSLRCEANSGCFYTQNYASDPVCAQMLLSKTQFSGQCTYLNSGDVITVPFCYVSDPIDGPTVLWKRSDAKFGVSLKVNHFNPQNITKSLNSTWVQLFYGIQVLSFTKFSTVVDSKNQSSLDIISASPVQSSSESSIDSTNFCCPATISNAFAISYKNSSSIRIDCRTDSLNSTGNANDYYSFNNNTLVQNKGQFYQLKLRSFPTHTSMSISKPSLISLLISSTGGFMEIILTAFTIIAFLYRRFRKSNQENKVAPK